VKINVNAARTAEVASTWSLVIDLPVLGSLVREQAPSCGSGMPVAGARLGDLAYPQTVSARKPQHRTDRMRTFAVVDGTSGSRTCSPPI
jgi:hypothetical protein